MRPFSVFQYHRLRARACEVQIAAHFLMGSLLALRARIGTLNQASI
jgi:hypothetical protein